jgi:hypothetical protein
LLFGGPLLYLLSQTVYLWAVAGRRSLPRLAGIAALVVAEALSSLLAASVALGVVAALLLALVVIVVRERDATARPDASPTARLDSHPPAPFSIRNCLVGLLSTCADSCERRGPALIALLAD